MDVLSNFFLSLLLHLNCKVINKPLVKGKRKREKVRRDVYTY